MRLSVFACDLLCLCVFLCVWHSYGGFWQVSYSSSINRSACWCVSCARVYKRFACWCVCLMRSCLWLCVRLLSFLVLCVSVCFCVFWCVFGPVAKSADFARGCGRSSMLDFFQEPRGGLPMPNSEQRRKHRRIIWTRESLLPKDFRPTCV